MRVLGTGPDMRPGHFGRVRDLGGRACEIGMQAERATLARPERTVDHPATVSPNFRFRMFHVKHLYEKSGNEKMDDDSCAQALGRTRSA